MKKIIVMIFLMMLLSSCTSLNKDTSLSTYPVSSTNNSTVTTNKMNNSTVANNNIVKFPINTYGVYEVYNSNTTDNKFDQTMIANPIDKKMHEEIKTVDISSTRESQIFYDRYVKMWQEELTFSISNLKKHLKSDDLKALEIAQTAWEESWKSNGEFDKTLIEKKKIGLGTQYVASSLIYLISQYRDRVFHIKYMTMLVETYVDNPVPENERLWNKFTN